MSADTGRELVTAAATEARTLAERTEGVIRKRLLVLAHALELAERDLTDEPVTSEHDIALCAALRAGEYDADLVTLIVALRPRVLREIAVARPGYDRKES